MVPRLVVVAASSIVLACAGSAPPSQGRILPAPAQLTCGDSSMPRATIRLAGAPVRTDSLAGLVVRMHGAPPHGRFDGAQVQIWGNGWGAGGFVDSLDTYTWTARPAGLYSLRIVSINGQPRRWIYAVTLRPGFVDTADVTLTERCTLIWRR